MQQITCDFPEGVLPIGTKVYIPRAPIKSVHEDVIRGYYCTMYSESERLTIIPTDYRLSIMNIGRGSFDDGWKRDEFFLSYEEAKAMAVEYTADLEPEEWFKAIGLNGADNEDRIAYDDECELTPCCSNISDIRDILYNICVSGKINGVTRLALIALLNAHEPPHENAILNKILAQLDLTWKETGNEASPYVTETKNETNNDTNKPGPDSEHQSVPVS